MRLPFEVTRAGVSPVNRAGETKNLSSSGVLFSIEAPFAIGESIEYIITLPVTRTGEEPVRLRCVGKVVRTESASAAATLERYEFIP